MSCQFNPSLLWLICMIGYRFIDIFMQLFYVSSGYYLLPIEVESVGSDLVYNSTMLACSSENPAVIDIQIANVHKCSICVL